MRKNKINFITGETYTIAELFSGDRRIIIPDLQRDYCWGDETNKKSTGEVGELVSDFINNLINEYENKQSDTLNLGLFYGYEVPANHIQLCDGQQRLTTLYLLLGMLNKKGGKFQQYLHNDKELYLNYAIRESSLYFLSDLVCRFFISNSDDVKRINGADAEWYFCDYDLDPSIRSMINALNKIEAILKDKDGDWIQSFGEWVLNKLTFLYFDMENRNNGEETFVIINTTGEPLSSTQNLKPLVINANNTNKEEVAKRWEEIETWFWKNRQGENDTADAGFAEFLRWISIIEQKDVKLEDAKESLIQSILRGEGKYKFDYNKIKFDDIYKYWAALEWTMENNSQEDKAIKGLFSFEKKILSPSINSDGKAIIEQNDCFVLLPILRYAYNNWGKINADTGLGLQQNIKRLYKFLQNIIRVDNVSKAVNTLVRDAIRIADLLKGGDIVSLLGKSEDISTQILTEEENYKLNILKDSENRKEIEELFWEIQEHPIWNGEILPIIKWATDEKLTFQFGKFSQYTKLFQSLFSGEFKHEPIVNLLRRCIIAAKQEKYKPINRGTYDTFGWEWTDWRKLLCRGENQIKDLFEFILAEKEQPPNKNIEGILEAYIKAKVEGKNFAYLEFAKDDFLLSFTNSADCCDMKKELNDWQICTSGGTGRHTSFFSRRNAYILKAFDGSCENNGDNKKELNPPSGWLLWYWPDNAQDNCVVFENKDNGYKLDTRFISYDEAGAGTLKIIVRPSNNSKMKDHQSYDAVLNALNSIGMKDYIETGTGDIVIKNKKPFAKDNIKQEIENIINKLSE